SEQCEQWAGLKVTSGPGRWEIGRGLKARTRLKPRPKPAERSEATTRPPQRAGPRLARREPQPVATEGLGRSVWRARRVVLGAALGYTASSPAIRYASVPARPPEQNSAPGRGSISPVRIAPRAVIGGRGSDSSRPNDG